MTQREGLSCISSRHNVESSDPGDPIRFYRILPPDDGLNKVGIFMLPCMSKPHGKRGGSVQLGPIFNESDLNTIYTAVGQESRRRETER